MQFRCPAVLVGRLHCYKASRFYLFSLSLAPDPCPLCYTAVGPYSNTPLPPRFEKNWNLKQEVPQYEFHVVAEPVPDLFNCTRSSARNFDLREKFHFHVEQLQRIVKRCKMSIRITNIANISPYEGSCNYPWHLQAFSSAENDIKNDINKVNRCLARYSPRATTTNRQGTK